MPDPSGLYPAPPQQGQGLAGSSLLADPLRLIGAMRELQEYGIRQQQAPALAQQPAATLQGTQIQNTSAQMDQQAAARRIIAGEYGSMLQGMPNPTPDDVHSITAWLAATHPQIQAQYPGIISSTEKLILEHPKGIAAGGAMALNSALSPGEASGRVPGPPGVGGAPTSISVPQANMGGRIPTGLPPGYAERQAGLAASDTRLSGNLADAAEGSQGRRAILGNLENLVQNFTPGPGADWTKVAKSFVNRNVPLPKGWQFDPGSIASQEEFNKQAVQLAQQQFGAIGGTGTDAKFASAFETSPNDALSPLGNKGIIRLLKGNEDALQAKNEAWLAASTKNPNLSYRVFSGAFNKNFDPRVYQFKYMPQAERQAFFGNMNPDEQDRFLAAYKYAKDNKYVNYGVGQ